MDAAYFREYYALERKHWWFTVRGKILADLVRRYCSSQPDLRILNVGVATGATSEMLQQFGKVTSLEFDSDCCEFLRTEVGLEVTNGSVLELPFADTSFDLVCAFDVIEHVDDDRKAVTELQRVCRPGGHVFVTVPALMLLWSHHDVVNQHFRRYSKSQLLELFKSSNGIHYATYFNSLLFLPILAFRLMSRLLPDKLLRKGAGSDFTVFEDGVSNTILRAVFSMERKLLKLFRFPIGVSIACIWQKPTRRNRH